MTKETTNQLQLFAAWFRLFYGLDLDVSSGTVRKNISRDVNNFQSKTIDEWKEYFGDEFADDVFDEILSEQKELEGEKLW